mmetsp:Transcript_32762/g.48527  ORF Transcript_32762/g.48527 Transcript_32762/m.48527 type:complete len:89 (+) Transcript_32762:79-345(+)
MNHHTFLFSKRRQTNEHVGKDQKHMLEKGRCAAAKKQDDEDRRRRRSGSWIPLSTPTYRHCYLSSPYKKRLRFLKLYQKNRTRETDWL